MTRTGIYSDEGSGNAVARVNELESVSGTEEVKSVGCGTPSMGDSQAHTGP